MALNFEFNDPADVESFYTRSDHYSYASTGIPGGVLFLRDSRRLPRELGQRRPHPLSEASSSRGSHLPASVSEWRIVSRYLERDRLGPRAGRDFSGSLPKPGG
jgi:Zn-dependent M28 family amino/carboxypeptidase